MKQRMTSLNGKTDKMEKVTACNSIGPASKVLDIICFYGIISMIVLKLQGTGVDPEEDPLKWIEENIPESAETDNPLPVIDSDEEIETVINKI